uniref:GH16 domain-containing protein n=1 Tax=Mycena chlorophos TaxID=658473 RepID=A0ABQ0M2W7_MYCCL|nr:predicted protein [Mycena chlorophos]
MLWVLLLAGWLVQSSAYTSYSVNKTYTGGDFWHWNWETDADPTHGRVNYVNSSVAKSQGIASSSDSWFSMGADSQMVVPPGQRGRDSVRIWSREAFSDSVLVLDLRHMPTGCATWPAWWTVSQAGPWPHGGEIDIIEGVNLNTQNLGSLHTLPNCTVPQERYQNGTAVSTNCDATFNYNQGCGVAFSKPNSYGKEFNANKGGIYAMQRSPSGIRMWFWPHNDPKLPHDIYDPTVDPAGWGLAEASFPFGGCDYEGHFDAHNIVFDLTFCGDWAEAAYTQSTCATNCTCDAFVDNNPAAFKEAYWNITSLTVYTPGAPGLQ